MVCVRWVFLTLLVVCVAASPGDPLQGNVAAVYDLLDRVLPGAKAHFALSFTSTCPGVHAGEACYQMSDEGSQVKIAATGASELASALGHYFRDMCNMTIGWPRGGGSNVFIPHVWPKVGTVVSRHRVVPWSYMMNVCTNSYSIVWYDWAEWQAFIDWMALSGLNLVLAMTGQEEVQYKVFQKFGLNDTTIRHWFNGPAFLTWSRGQNEYGADIAGPLPRSWMKGQWNMQKQILARQRSLGISGQLPGFQGNVPVEMKELHHDANMTKAGATAWMDALDPLFGKIADEWMKTIIEDFGTDHWYQLDGYFNGKTAPWMDVNARALSSVEAGSTQGEQWVDVKDIPDDPMAYRRGSLAYQGLNRTDPHALWSYQGWAFIGWNKPTQAAALKAFVDATPKGKFVVVDMSTNGEGEWHKWSDAAFFGARFLWTTLHDFGGTDGMKGDLRHVNEIPWAALPPNASTGVWGTGFTPEGIDQNPVYYEFVLGAPFRTGRVADLSAHTVARGQRRYQVAVPAIDQAWSLLVQSAYAQDLSVQDSTGIPHFPGHSSQFLPDRRTPSQTLCKIFQAWELFVQGADKVSPTLIPFRYDLVNLGREVLAQLSTPVSMNFSTAISGHAGTLKADVLNRTAQLYIELLNDVDTLVATDEAFLLGPWIAMARNKAQPNDTDCGGNTFGVTTCPDFYEWNARTQLTTWNPTPKGAASIPGGPVDYASKHWSGLIRDYYGVRAELYLSEGLKAAASHQALDRKAMARLLALHAYDWTTSTGVYPMKPVGNALEVSKAMLAKYRKYYAACASA